jgi:hypothetical protein
MGRYAFYSLRKRRIYSTMVFGSGGLFTLVSLSHLLMRALTTLSASRSSLGSTGGSPKKRYEGSYESFGLRPFGQLAAPIRPRRLDRFLFPLEPRLTDREWCRIKSVMMRGADDKAVPLRQLGSAQTRRPGAQ